MSQPYNLPCEIVAGVCVSNIRLKRAWEHYAFLSEQVWQDELVYLHLIKMEETENNTPGTSGGPGGRD